MRNQIEISLYSYLKCQLGSLLEKTIVGVTALAEEVVSLVTKWFDAKLLSMPQQCALAPVYG